MTIFKILGVYAVVGFVLAVFLALLNLKAKNDNNEKTAILRAQK